MDDLFIFFRDGLLKTRSFVDGFIGRLVGWLIGWLVGSRVVLIKYPQLKDWETTKEQTSVLAA